jgi:hypothetical protein
MARVVRTRTPGDRSGRNLGTATGKLSSRSFVQRVCAQSVVGNFAPNNLHIAGPRERIFLPENMGRRWRLAVRGIINLPPWRGSRSPGVPGLLVDPVGFPVAIAPLMVSCTSSSHVSIGQRKSVLPSRQATYVREAVVPFKGIAVNANSRSRSKSLRVGSSEEGR